jgi:alanyl-tRNA synthetase
MKAKKIRKKFIEFFEDNGHKKWPSSSLVPHDDPTLLFANAGMNQFKDFFTGKAKAKKPRAVTVQKCVRAGGKHNDLENVGFTARHHTFFEMLGNFSFGDYFKSEAIDMAWKFLTKELKIPKEKLYVTVHDSDQEAADIWHNEQGVPRDRIFFMGDKDNFWEMGEIGPCGPCSEIFYDHGEEFSDGADTSECLLADEGRYVEIWNLVFMQFEKYKEGNEVKRRNLPKPSVDTGAGLERIAAAMNGKYWNYDSDLFSPIIEQIERLSRKKYSDKNAQGSIRVVADHARACTMLITDGVIPSNEGRGYVLRRIIRRAIRHLNELGVEKVSFYKLVDSVFEVLGEEYTDNKNNMALAKKLLELEEKKFRETLNQGLKVLDDMLKKTPNKLSGRDAFKLYDSYGFPLDLTQVILGERKIPLDEKEFYIALEEQKERSRKAGKFGASEDNKKVFYEVKQNNGETEFTGYKKTKDSSKLIFKELFGDTFALVFEKTPFYGESGGQVGDSGTVNSGDIQLATILDTQKPVDGLFVHYSKDADALEVGEKYDLIVDEKRRELIKRNHSATHLMHAALKEVLGDHVKQAGSLVTEDRLRFDFTQPEAMSLAEVQQVEDLVNREIQLSNKVESEVMKKDDAVKKGAQALFGEKYGENVRVIEMGPFSLELCGGIHVKNTSDIGLFKIISESSLSSGVRRIEALTSAGAFDYLRERSNTLSQIELSIAAKGEQVVSRIDALQSEIKTKQKEISKLNDKLNSAQSGELFDNTKKLDNGVDLTIAQTSSKDLRSLSDNYVDKFPKGILFLYSVEKQNLRFLLRTNKSNKSINCNIILKDALPLIEGRGGGRPDMAQGSGAKASELPQFLTKLEANISTITLN